MVGLLARLVPGLDAVATIVSEPCSKRVGKLHLPDSSSLACSRILLLYLRLRDLPKPRGE